METYTYMSRTPNTALSTAARILVEILSVVVLVLVVMSCLDWRPLYVKKTTHYPAKKVKLADFRTGDLLVTFCNAAPDRHRVGHLALLVEGPKYRQKFVWNMRTRPKSTNILHPLKTYLGKMKKYKTFVLHCEQPLNPRRTRQLLRQFQYVTLNCRAVSDGFNSVLHRMYLPGVGYRVPRAANVFNCMELVMELLVQVGVAPADIKLKYGQNNELYPFLLLQKDINPFLLNKFRYHTPVGISL